MARAPTVDELYDLLSELMEARLLHPEALPPELFVKLRQLIEWLILQPPWTYSRIQLARWSFVCEGLDIGEGWDGAFEYASEALKGSPAEAGPDMMKKSYDYMQARLPPAQRRKRTWKRGPPRTRKRTPLG